MWKITIPPSPAPFRPKNPRMSKFEEKNWTVYLPAAAPILLEFASANAVASCSNFVWPSSTRSGTVENILNLEVWQHVQFQSMTAVNSKKPWYQTTSLCNWHSIDCIVLNRTGRLLKYGAKLLWHRHASICIIEFDLAIQSRWGSNIIQTPPPFGSAS